MVKQRRTRKEMKLLLKEVGYYSLKGLNNKDISAVLGISKQLVNYYLKKLCTGKSLHKK